MSPATWLGIGAALLSVAFVLALPGIFEVEPADQVEPINFGPVPAAGLTGAEQVAKPKRRPDPRDRSAESSATPVESPALEPPPVVAGDDGFAADDDDGGQPADDQSGSPDDSGEGGDDAGAGGQGDGDDDAAPPPPPPADDDAGGADDADDAEDSEERDEVGD